MAEQPSSRISPGKACQILADGTANGHPLTDAQRRMFGAACGEKHKAVEEAIKHLDAAGAHGFEDIDEKTAKRMQAAHKYHAARLKEYLRDTEGTLIHNPTA